FSQPRPGRAALHVGGDRRIGSVASSRRRGCFALAAPMAGPALYGALCRAKLTLEFLHANSTTHDFIFGAIAELIDNSRDAGATRLDIYTDEATNIVYFGRSSKRKDPTMIGRYGNGLKSGSMRIGNDLILFTKKENTITHSVKQKVSVSEDELMNQFNVIYGKTGTLLVIYNLKLALNGEPELDILTDEKDILTDRMPENYPEEKSLRAYTAILYLNPRMRIFIQAEKAQKSEKTEKAIHNIWNKHSKQNFGAGAVGIIDVPLDIMEPTHNKQAFANIKEYRHLLKSMENYLIQYWKDMGISQKGEKFWNDFGYLSDKWCERPSEIVQYKRRRAAEIPYIVQCDVCLKWRLLSLNTDINNEVHDIWNCGRSPNSLENKCSIPENLPRIPLGTFNPTHYLNNKEKLLIDSIQRNKRKVENLQLCLIQPHKFSKHTDDSKTPAKDNVCQKTFYKDSSQAYRHPSTNNASKGHMQQSNYRKQALATEATCSQRRRQFYQDEKKIPMADRKNHSTPKILPSVCFERLCYEEPELKIETENKPEIIYITSSDSETEDLPKDELFAGCVLMKKEKQEQHEETSDSFLGLNKHGKSKKWFKLSAHSKSISTEAIKEDKDQVFIVEEKSVEVSCLTENSQSITKAKMIQTLTSRIKEILLYFLPECDKSRNHITSMCPEDVLSMFNLKRHWDHNKTVILSIDQYFSQYERQLSKKLKRQEECCFQKVYAIERQIYLRKEQVKATQKKLEHLRRKIALLLSRMNPNYKQWKMKILKMPFIWQILFPLKY
ncbi:hypothetical protein E2320_005262, partial [Naja naja]